MSLSAPAARFTLKGWHVAAMVVGFFAVVVALDTSFAVIAMRTFPGEVSATPYEDGQAYNRKLDQLAAQAALGWRATAEATPGGELVVTLRDRAGAPVAGAQVSARLERPATEAGRRSLALKETSPGVYAARPKDLHGAWDLSLAAQDRAGGRLEAERRLIWP